MTSNSLIAPSYVQSRKMHPGIDFAVYTGAMIPAEQKELSEEDQGKPIVRMVGSSTVKDLQGDIMTLSALQDMTQVSPDLLLYLNHTYDLPDAVFGRLYGSPTIQMQKGIADLWLTAQVVLSNPAAEKTYNYIVKDKLRLGCSVGCQVLDWEFADPEDPYSAVYIKHVYVVEWSVVSVPANQRCWVENAIKGLFGRLLIEGNGDAVRQLAPTFKSLFSRDYESVTNNVTSEGLRKDLTLVKSRTAPRGRIMYTFDGEEGFYLDDGKRKKSLTRDETAALLQKHSEPEVTKAATGKTSWPLMALDTEWTGSRAESQIFDWARNDDGDIVATKAKQCFLHCDPDNSDKQSGYSCPYCYIVDGSPKIVPLGVRACANVLSGGRGGVGASANDQDGMKAKVKTMYGRINSEFSPDPAWVVPWEKDEKSAGILETTSGSAPVRQDLGEEVEEDEDMKDKEKAAMPDAKDVEVKSDGTHAACKGVHEHPHTAAGSQGDDDMHTHSHEHNGDADHGHSHDDSDVEKSTEHVDKVASEEQAHEESPAHSHVEETIEEKGTEQTAVTKEVPAEEVKELDPITLAKLSLLNSLNKDLGLAELTIEQYRTKCSLVDSEGDAAIARSVLSALDDCSDAMVLMAQRTDSYVDQLMSMLGVPDTNDGDAVSAPSGYYSLSDAGITTKDGREISAKNALTLGMVHDHSVMIHDMIASLHPDACKCTKGIHGDGTQHQSDGKTVADAQEEARQMGQGQGYNTVAGLASLDNLAKAFESFNVKSAVDGAVSKAVGEALAQHRKQLLALQEEQQAVAEQLGKLKNMPVGRPTTLTRTVQPSFVREGGETNIASYEDLLSVNGTSSNGTLADALAQTRVEKGYRIWEAGVGKGVRPPLTSDQKSMMRPDHILAYQDLGFAMVPLIDDPVEVR
ncbi:MAG TPA: HK97 family phage prohead protease [Ktedonobacteraceae bacterium]|nr:HK97 family phage prohead protease [Ktedonobacteraceae bacterium]